MTIIDNDISLLERLSGIIKRHLAMMLSHSEVMSNPADVYNEIAGAFADETALNPQANHAYIYMASAYLEVVKSSDVDEVISGLKTLDEVLAVLVERHYEVKQDKSKK